MGCPPVIRPVLLHVIEREGLVCKGRKNWEFFRGRFETLVELALAYKSRRRAGWRNVDFSGSALQIRLKGKTAGFRPDRP